ncbi:hypothetical protein KC19_7G137300 [Ceratodon purpureus]|uniref:Uncharacterized protein n=1 Tax=Ceratodon purpureus TaxID=3225 RepID=A0A8T0HAU9_CERPU|nr:hypothetical protein KC19_7G137300 [Ceratodon purpureus]
MSGCHSYRYAYTENDDCSAHHSASVFYFISTIAAMVVLGSITLLFFCCIYFKRRRIAERLRNARNRGQQITSANSPVMYVWPGTADEAAAGPTSQTTHTAALAEANYNISKGMGTSPSEPLSCVIMAGEDRPTHLAKPLPREDFEHVGLDRKVDDLERGKRRQP